MAQHSVFYVRVTAAVLHQCAEHLSTNAGGPPMVWGQLDQHRLAAVPAMGLRQCSARDGRRVCDTYVPRLSALALCADSHCCDADYAGVFLERRNPAGGVCCAAAVVHDSWDLRALSGSQHRTCGPCQSWVGRPSWVSGALHQKADFPQILVQGGTLHQKSVLAFPTMSALLRPVARQRTAPKATLSVA